MNEWIAEKQEYGVDVPERPSAYGALGENLDRLEKGIEHLASRIHPVLAPDTPIAEVPQEKSIGAPFESEVDRLRLACNRLEQLAGRVAL